MNNKDKAKKMFFDYACRHFHMDRDGIGEAYKKFGISKAQEEWRQEYISFTDARNSSLPGGVMTAFVASSLFEGTWHVTEATLPNGDFGYTGTITIQRSATTFALNWDISAGRFVGLGLALEEHLFVSCAEQYAGLGLALYHLQADDQVSIQWCTAEMPGSIGTGTFTTPWQGSFEGNHQVVQYLPDGRLYGEWSLSIQKADRIYELTWWKGAAIHLKGMGLDTPRGLAASWYPDLKQLAFLDYMADPDDWQRLKAVWGLGGYTGLGTETLTRQ